MWPRASVHVAAPEAAEVPSAKTLLEQVGWVGLLLIVWRATPSLLRIVALPYGIITYRRLLAASYTQEALRALHAEKYESSPIFRLLRPRYREVERFLKTRATIDDAPHTDSRQGRRFPPQSPGVTPQRVASGRAEGQRKCQKTPTECGPLSDNNAFPSTEAR
jgi:hypothetical protein